jgi:hypothetical protein
MIMDKISALKRTQLFGELEEPELCAPAERAVERRRLSIKQLLPETLPFPLLQLSAGFQRPR